jgi:Protein of unknown function (DUF2971)
MDLSALSNLLMLLNSPHRYFVQSIDAPICHYTDLPALRSIVGTQDLWLTDARFSNDTEEMAHGFNVVQEVIAQRIRRARGAKTKAFLADLQKRLEATRERGVYVSCFCMADDLLGQWRSYGANGTGVSIKLTTREFQYLSGPDLASGDFGLMYLWRVFYDSRQQGKIVNDCLDNVLRGPEPAGGRLQLADDALRFFIPIFKNHDFSSEEEVRLVFAPAESCPVQPDFRMSRGMLVPYFSLRALAAAAGRTDWRLPIESVLVGPSHNREINRRSVELLLQTGGYESVSVDVSMTPYRG